VTAAAGLLRRFRAAREGATIVEFALVATPFIILVMGLLDLGFREYTNVMLQGALNEAARQVTVGGVTNATITTFVQGRMATIVPQGNVVITPSSYADFTGIQTMEPLTTDVNGNGALDPGDCYTDYNRDGTRDTNNGISGTGGSDDIVYYTATLTYPSFVPVQRLFGFSTSETVTATTMLKNQPYASQGTPPTVCV
jgi:Flp pilus assembly protein TadG